MTRLARLGGLVLIIMTTAAAALAQPPLWVVHGRHAKIVLFGSVHMLPRGVDWEPSVLTEALKQADEIWFELPIDQATDVEAARLFAARGIAPGGDDLFTHLSAEGGSRLRRVSEALGVASQTLAHMRPWLADLTLSLAMDEKAGALSSQGVEQKIEAAASPQAKRLAFETTAQQVAILADAPLAEQIASLNESLDEFETDPGGYRREVDEWVAGDLTGLANDALLPLARSAPGFYRRLITDRNQRWAAVLARQLHKPGTLVVVVGVGHLIGPGGVPALLRDRGFNVEGPQ